LQNYGSSKVPIFYYVFDLPMLAGRDLRSQTLDVWRDLLMTKVFSKLREPVRYSPVLNASLPDLIRSVREQGLEGLVAKRSKPDDSVSVVLNLGLFHIIKMDVADTVKYNGFPKTCCN
jgi:ATP-dependent DNA ligase